MEGNRLVHHRKLSCLQRHLPPITPSQSQNGVVRVGNANPSPRRLTCPVVHHSFQPLVAFPSESNIPCSTYLHSIPRHQNPAILQTYLPLLYSGGSSSIVNRPSEIFSNGVTSVIIPGGILRCFHGLEGRRRSPGRLFSIDD